jgi:adenylyltransferase/sulfurtransferase
VTTTIVIPTALRAFTGQAARVEVEGGTVGELLQNLARAHPELQRHLFTEDGRLRSYVNVYVNDEDARHLGGPTAPVHPGDVVSIVPSIAGGASDDIDLARRTADLSPEELQRYSRHLMLPEVGVEGQQRLKAASVLLIGAGGLGAPLGMYLAAAGVGRLGLVDFDVVDFTNLQRQVTFATGDVGRRKLEAARERLRGINPHVEITTHETRLDSSNALAILRPYDVVVDGTDNFPTRYLVNDACVLLGKPNVYGSIFRFEGQASVFWAAKGPCYRCLYAEPPPPGLVPSCAEGGVLGVLPGVIGTIQAIETIKLLVGQGETLVGRLLLFDALGMRFRELRLRKDPSCRLCGLKPSITQLIDYEAFCGEPAQHAAAAAQPGEISAADLAARLARQDDLVLVDVREPHEWQICRIEGARLVPLRSLPARLGELPRDRDIVVHCKMGARSAKAVEFLRAHGYEQVWNLCGGILAWIDAVDPSLRRY